MALVLLIVVLKNYGGSNAPAVPAQQPTAQQPSAPAQINLQGVHVRGPDNAKITIVEYSDFECPFCGRAVPTINQVMKDYDGKVKLVYKHFPLSSIHPNAQPAAEASECAGDQGKFWEYHDLLFANQLALGKDSLVSYAKQLGLNEQQFTSCLDSGKFKQKVLDDFNEGAQNGVSGTPTFYINGQQLVGAQPYSAFKQVFDQILG